MIHKRGPYNKQQYNIKHANIYTTDRARPGLVTFYDIWPGNGTGLFLQPRNPHGALKPCGHYYGVPAKIGCTGSRLLGMEHAWPQSTPLPICVTMSGCFMSMGVRLIRVSQNWGTLVWGRANPLQTKPLPMWVTMQILISVKWYKRMHHRKKLASSRPA